MRLVRLRRWLLALSAAALMWAGGVIAAGGFVLRVGDVRLSSRSPLPSLLIAAIALLAAVVISRRLGSADPWRDAASRGRARDRVRSALPSIALAAVPAAMLVVDVHQLLGAAPLWLDEQMIALNLRDRTVTQLAGPLWLQQSAPYGWLVVQRAMLVTAGTSEIALRLVPTIFGIATYAAAWWIARRWLSWIGGATLVLLCALGHQLTHFRVELKHYSADAFWGLLLPALAVWATEGTTSAARRRRIVSWWLVAAMAQWTANGALLVTPASALLLIAITIRQDGVRTTRSHVTGAAMWITSFAVHYAIALRHTAGLRAYWASAFPPADAGITGTVNWLLSRTPELASSVAGSAAGAWLWIVALCGLLISARRTLGIAYAAVILSSFVLAALGIVPMYERFALWMLPSLYAGIALLMDRGMRTASIAIRAGRVAPAIGGAALAIVAAAITGDVVSRGIGRLHLEPPQTNHGVDDRTSVAWLMRQWQPGDVFVTTPLGVPAILWYGGIPIQDRSDGSPPIYQAEHRARAESCALDAVRSYSRVLVHAGFPDMPSGFDEMLLTELARVGPVVAYLDVSVLSRAAIVDVGGTGSHHPAFRSRPPRSGLEGCPSLRPAARPRYLVGREAYTLFAIFHSPSTLSSTK